MALKTNSLTVYTYTVYMNVWPDVGKKFKEQNQNGNLVMFIRDYQSCQTKPFWAADNTTFHS